MIHRSARLDRDVLLYAGYTTPVDAARVNINNNFVINDNDGVYQLCLLRPKVLSCYDTYMQGLRMGAGIRHTCHI